MSGSLSLHNLTTHQAYSETKQRLKHVYCHWLIKKPLRSLPQYLKRKKRWVLFWIDVIVLLKQSWLYRREMDCFAFDQWSSSPEQNSPASIKNFQKFSCCSSREQQGSTMDPTAAKKHFEASLLAQLVKNPPAMQETLVRFLGWEDPLEKG